MSREAKIFELKLWSAQETITHYESFGWELLSVNGNQLTMSHETQNPVHSELVKLQRIYEDKVAEYERLRKTGPTPPTAPLPVSAMACLFSFVCLVIPCAIYVTYKISQNKKYKNELSEYEDQLEEHNRKIEQVRKEISDTILKGKATFFSKQ